MPHSSEIGRRETLAVIAGLAVSGCRKSDRRVIGALHGTKVWHVPIHGQSNATADDAAPPLTTSPTGWGSLSFLRGIRTWHEGDHPQEPAARDPAGFEFADLIATAVETRANGLADHFKSRLMNVETPAEGGDRVLISMAAVGGRGIAELGPENHGASAEIGARAPGGFWPTLLDDLARAKVATETAGASYRIPFWNWDQGEREGFGQLYANRTALSVSQTILAYSERARTMVRTFDQHVRVLTGVAEPTVCIVTPACVNMVTPTAWLDVCDSTTLAVLVGPRYQMPSALLSDLPDNGVAARIYRYLRGRPTRRHGARIHYGPDGQRWIGEMVAKVGARVVLEGETWQPLRVLRAVRHGPTTVDLILHVPRGPLVLDTETWPRVEGWGFRIYGGTVDRKADIAAANEIALIGGDRIRLSFPVIPDSASLSIGDTSIYSQMSKLTVSAVEDAEFEGRSAYSLLVVGGRADVARQALAEGACLAMRSDNGFAVIRAARVTGTDLRLIGETTELDVEGKGRPFRVGDRIALARVLPCTNIRDSDPAHALNRFTTGPRKGLPYPLQNWLAQYDGLRVEGT